MNKYTIIKYQAAKKYFNYSITIFNFKSIKFY